MPRPALVKTVLLIVAPPLALHPYLQLVCQRHHAFAGPVLILFAGVSSIFWGSSRTDFVQRIKKERGV